MYTDDKSALDKLTAAFYNLFTTKEGEQIKLDAVYDMFISKGIIIKNVDPEPEIYGLQQFIEPREKILSDGTLKNFNENEISERTEIFGNIAHRFSLYQKSGIMNGVSFETKGVKTMQFIKTPSGWKFSSVAWDDEREGLKIHAKYY